jgi:hypothetical protein
MYQIDDDIELVLGHVAMHREMANLWLNSSKAGEASPRVE